MKVEVKKYEKSVKYLYHLQELHKERIKVMLEEEPILQVGSLDTMSAFRGYQDDEDYTLVVPTEEQYKRKLQIEGCISDLVSLEDDMVLTDVDWHNGLLENLVAFDMGYRQGLKESKG